MTDRELLEMAAIAAGIELRVSAVRPAPPEDGDGFIGYMANPGQWPRGWFDPLNNDGDALRLAVTLSFIDEGDWPAITNEIYDHCNGDWFAATRRAITVAAAKIGKSIP